MWKEVGGTRTYFHYSDEGLIGEFDASGVEIKAYGYKPGSTWTTDPLFMKIGSEYYFYQNDHLGTPQKMTSVSGAVVWSAKYNSFGKATIDGSSTITNNLRFPGQYEDEETGLSYNRYRYYDRETGRYITKDPIGFDGGINVYVYAMVNPLNKIDPYGLCPPGYRQAGNECWPMDNETYPCGAGRVDDGTGTCVDVWPPNPPPAPGDEGLYCGTITRAISGCADTVTIGAVIATVSTGGTASPATVTVAATARIVSAGNGVITLILCGPSWSSLSTAASAVPGPAWWTTLTAAADAALNVLDL